MYIITGSEDIKRFI